MELDLKCCVCGNTVETTNKMPNIMPDGKVMCQKCADFAHVYFYAQYLSGTVKLADKEEKREEKEEKQNFVRPAHLDIFAEDMDNSNDEWIEEEALPTIKDIYNHLCQFVIGQEEAKRTLSVAVAKHIQKAAGTKKDNILMVGPSGSGKTYIVQTIADFLHVPFVIVDANSFTESGYYGDDVESIIVRLYEAANKDVEKAEHGIVFIDEIDKTTNYSKKKVAGKNIQNSLLKIVEGTKVPISYGRGNTARGAQKPQAIIDTKNILFICGGAFEGLRNDVDTVRPIGFAREMKVPVKKAKIDIDMLMQYGITREFIGRFPVLCELQQLAEADFISIIKNQNNSIIREYETVFALNGMEIVFDDGVIEKIAHIAFESGCGARGIRGIFEKITRDRLFEGNEDVCHISEKDLDCFE